MKTMKINRDYPDDMVWIDSLREWRLLSKIDPAAVVFDAQGYRWNGLDEPLNPDRRHVRLSQRDWALIMCSYNGSEWLVGGEFHIMGKMYVRRIKFVPKHDCWHHETRKGALLECLITLQRLVDDPFNPDRMQGLRRITALAKEVASMGTIYQSHTTQQLSIF